MSVSKRLRYEVFRRDAHACRYCGAAAPDVRLTVDHVVPVSLGGGDKPENLVTACADCNSGKSSTSPDAPLVANVADDALRWARAMGMAAAAHRAHNAAADDFVESLGELWEDYFHPSEAEWNYHRLSGWRGSARRFQEAGLDGDDMCALVEDVMSRSYVSPGAVWKYFCGACWRLIERRQQEARALIESGEA